MKATTRRNLLLSIAIVAGMFAASALPAQTQSPLMIQGYADSVEEPQDSLTEVRNDYLRVHNSLARIRAYKGSQLQWMGSANAMLRKGGKIFILSNKHVMGGDVSITAEFFANGRSLGEHPVTVLLDTQDDGNDIAVGSVKDTGLEGVQIVPLSKRENIKVGADIYWVGASSGEWPNGQMGEVKKADSQYFWSIPTSIPGDSGSSIVTFDEAGNPSIAGLTAWYSTVDGRRHCMSMHTNVVIEVIKGFEKIRPKKRVEPDRVQPPQKRPFRKFFRGLRGAKEELDAQLPRFQELLGKLNRINEEQRIRNDHYNKMAAERIAELEEAKLFNGRLLKRLGGLSEGIDDMKNYQEEQQSLTDKLLGSVASVSLLVRIVKIMFWGMIALLVASLFFKQGWATTMIVGTVVFFFKTSKLAVALIKNALVAKSEAPTSTQDAIDDIREGIEDGINEKI